MKSARSRKGVFKASLNYLITLQLLARQVVALFVFSCTKFILHCSESFL